MTISSNGDTSKSGEDKGKNEYPNLIRIKKGQVLNPSGMSKGAKQHKTLLQEAVIAATTPQMMQDALAALYKRGMKNNDFRSLKLWLEYTIGKPAQTLEISAGQGDVNDQRMRLAALLKAQPEAIAPYLPSEYTIIKRINNDAPTHAQAQSGEGEGKSSSTAEQSSAEQDSAGEGEAQSSLDAV